MDRRVAAALVGRSIDAVHASDVGLAGASDVAVFDWAAGQERVIVTRDYRDFSRLAKAAQLAGRSFPGVLLVSRALRPGSVGAVADAFARYVETRREIPLGTVDWLTGG